MDIEKLIEQLRWWADNCDRTNYGCQVRRILSGAATAIETLWADLARVTAERDAAVKCIGEIEDALKFQRISAIGLRISEWRNTKED